MLKDIKVKSHVHTELHMIKGLHDKKNMNDVIEMLLINWRKR